MSVRAGDHCDVCIKQCRGKQPAVENAGTGDVPFMRCEFCAERDIVCGDCGATRDGEWCTRCKCWRTK